jgi:hypothetical protein
MTYKEKAKCLINSNFWVAGIGHFNLNIEDISEVLEILDKKTPHKYLLELYEKLSKQRLG